MFMDIPKHIDDLILIEAGFQKRFDFETRPMNAKDLELDAGFQERFDFNTYAGFVFTEKKSVSFIKFLKY